MYIWSQQHTYIGKYTTNVHLKIQKEMFMRIHVVDRNIKHSHWGLIFGIVRFTLIWNHDIQ